MKLTPELIPQTSFFKNLRSELKAKDWDLLRNACYSNAGHRCEICNGVGKKHPVECHEIWDYDMCTGVQTLKSLIALFPPCHEVKHHGLAEIRGRLYLAKKHLMAVNNITSTQADKAFEDSWILWNLRNSIQWKLDIAPITNILKL